ncbi:MAG: hypothetical protein IJ193_01655 [Bacilli bacterium]|nr:hypothetical protein [Bacilli bacterium]
MKKRNLWYFTLLSIIFVLCVYYVTIPNDLLTTIEDTETEENVVSTIQEASSLVAMRVNLQEERQEEMEVLQKEMTSMKSNEEKNNAYEKLKYLNEVQSKEEESELKIKKELKLDCFVKMEQVNINCVCISNEHNESLANQVMRLLQESYDSKRNITVKFQKS